MALGADRASVLRMGAVAAPAADFFGVVISLASAFAMNRVLASRLFGVRPSDPGTIAPVVALIGGVALVACYMTARTAMPVDPMIVLRDEQAVQYY